ncbi:Ig-like domain-containing protein [Massilibacteroides sp.]|uniref:Ig-like domain-containing protein n=1 Tax=Massilibacteroides sp. TaxID=2034766 RepID=UPI0026243367|nr:Ig-like domain-containing protein [Massilibacteroides sp.]MDD4515281.1 Ig-like domain-containing protein [Massilibacteroides sp.]
MKYSNIRYCLLALPLCLLFYSCANIASPNGGPYDETPPKMISSMPELNQTNFKGNKIELVFDELIQVEQPSENVIITPPQLVMPVIRPTGNRILVELKDSLKENTTYTIDFTNSVADNNEKNVLENFTFAFSTGDVIDTLEVSGILLNAADLEPMPGIIVGIHNNLEDSAFVKTPFLRTSKTNDKGRFTIRNLSEGTYRIFALNDANRDFKFDQPGEEIAFNDSTFSPTFEFSTRQDTIWKDTLTVDTVLVVPYTHFLPDDIELFLFKENFERQYLQKTERPQEHLGVLTFNAPLDTIPVPVPLDFTPSDSAWYYVQTMDDQAVINYWITDPSLLIKDTLSFELTYPKSDSLNVLQAQTDTLQFVMRRRANERKKKDDEEAKPLALGMNIYAPSSMDIFDTIHVEFTEPVFDVSSEYFVLDQMKDSVWMPVEFDFFQDTTNSLAYYIRRKWNYDEEYRLEVDSAQIKSVYSKWNDPFSAKFRIKKKEDYGNLYVNIQGLNSPGFVELLNSTDAPVRKAMVKDGGVLFMDLKPDKYYARLIVDVNGNGEWDTGNYAEKLQPEKVYYYPKLFDVMQNWDVEETWDVLSTPVVRQKPMEITKNKPKEVTKKKRDYKNEGTQNKSSSNSSSGMSGIQF